MATVDSACIGFPLRPPISSEPAEASSFGRRIVVFDIIRPSTWHLQSDNFI